MSEFEYQRQSGEIDQLMSAMNRAQLAMLPAAKDKVNPFYHSNYADLATVWEALHPFRVEGIVFTQSPMESPDGHIILETQLTHAASGQWQRSLLKVRLAKDDPQGTGSALTYARRYALGCMTGLVTEEDDDGNAASTPPATTKDFAKKFPEQAKKIREKLKVQGDGLVSGTSATQDADPRNAPVSQDAPAPLLPASTWVVPFGRDKGKSISDVSEGGLDYLLAYYTGKLNDPALTTSRYRDEWEWAILEVRAEMLARFPEECR